jgi:hypothetical protein
MNAPSLIVSMCRRRKPRSLLQAGQTEKRKGPRHIVELPLRYLTQDKARWGMAADISEVGILVYLHEPLQNTVPFKIEIFFPSGIALDRIEAQARVAWSEAIVDAVWGEYRHGLAFQSFYSGSRDKLKTLVRQSVEFAI